MSNTYRDLRGRLDSGQASCAEIVAETFRKIEQGKHLNAFLALFQERAAACAVRVDERLKAGVAGALAGMTVAVKDNIAVEGEQLTCGSRILAGFRSLYSASAIRYLEAADAIIVGKTNMDEFAMGSSGENSAYGPTLNPVDTGRVPGGSSSGSAVAVAAGMTLGALGSETGGSVRQPASFVGCVGVKPTYGRVSRYGLVAFASSLDQIGALAGTVHDAALLLQTIAGHDENDMTSAPEPVGDLLSGLDAGDVRGVRIGIPAEYFIDGIEPAVATAIRELRHRMEDAGAETVEISLPHTEYTIPCYYVIAPAEASSNLARFDGARYGYRSPEATTVEEMYELSRSQGFGAEVQRRIMVGTFVLSSGYYDAYYRRAQQVRRLIHDDFQTAFRQVDAILTPTTPTTAFKFGEKSGDPIAMYLSDIFTASANIAGVPAISVPIGTDPAGMPIGAQIITRHFDERRMFEVAAWVERGRG